MAEATTSHQLLYITESNIAVWQSIEAQAALDFIVERKMAVLGQSFEGETIDSVELFLLRPDEGSLTEDLPPF